MLWLFCGVFALYERLTFVNKKSICDKLSILSAIKIKQKQYTNFYVIIFQTALFLIIVCILNRKFVYAAIVAYNPNQEHTNPPEGRKTLLTKGHINERR